VATESDTAIANKADRIRKVPRSITVRLPYLAHIKPAGFRAKKTPIAINRK
jgi:hypothetical protein